MSDHFFHVVTLCGSMRFREQMLRVAEQETRSLHVVIAPFAVVALLDQDSEFKKDLDALHIAKIDMCDEVVVVSDESGYIGDSTVREIAYAMEQEIPVRYARVSG